MFYLLSTGKKEHLDKVIYLDALFYRFSKFIFQELKQIEATLVILEATFTLFGILQEGTSCQILQWVNILLN